MYPRPKGAFEKQDDSQAEPPPPEVGLLDLLQAFRQVVERIDKVKLYEIVGEDITIEERLNFVLKEITEKKQMKFFDLFASQTRKLVLVITFFAMLELIRLGHITVRQEGLFGEIMIYKVEANPQPVPA
jgi:segregation and condensation protein A